MNERSGACEQREQGRASERVSNANKQANRRASGPVLTSIFLVVPDHSAPVERDADNDIFGLGVETVEEDGAK